MITFDKVDFRENCAAVKVCREVQDIRKWIPVMCSEVIEASIVAAWSQTTVFFGHHVKRRGPRALRTADDSRIFQLWEFGDGDAELFGVETSRLGENGAARRFDYVFHAVERQMGLLGGN